MVLCVGERERRAPRAAEHQPALDAEVFAQRSRSATRCGRRVVLEAARRAASSGPRRAGRRPRSGRPRGRRIAGASASIPIPARRGGRRPGSPAGSRRSPSTSRGWRRAATCPTHRARSPGRARCGARRSSHCVIAAVDEEIGAGHERRGVGREEERGGRELRRLPEAAEQVLRDVRAPRRSMSP